MAKKNKWFKINSPLKTKNIVEYSTDFDFFSNHQIRVVRVGARHTFCSRLEAKTFKIERALSKDGGISDFEIVQKVKTIHSEILKGQHGEGVLID